MLVGQIAASRTAAQCFCALLIAVGGGCSKKTNSGRSTGAPSPSASVGAKSNGTSRSNLACTTRGTSFSLGPVEGERAAENTDDSEGVPGDAKSDVPSEPAIDLPFGVTVGAVRAHNAGFVVSAIDARQGGSHAVLAFLDAEVAKGSVLDLGRVYGDSEPPRMVVRSDGIFVVVPDTDAAGHSFRYGWVRGFDARSPLQWLGSFEQEVDESPVFALADTSRTMTVAWDEIDKRSKRGVVRWASFDPSGRKLTNTAGESGSRPSAKSKVDHEWLVQATGVDVDAEAPQLVAHAAGYWLAYLASDPSSAKAPGQASDGRGKRSEGGEDVRAIDLGRRGVEIVALDLSGRASAKPIRVAERSAHVVTFDIEATADGGAIVAYRDVDTAPGAEAQVIDLARVRTDGGVEHLRLDDERVGAGMPMLLVDSTAQADSKNLPLAWLAVAGSAGETRLAPVPASGTAVPDFVDAPELVGVEPMHWQGESLLVARHRARFVEFERVHCVWQAPQASGAMP